jgi:STE24 endopeptidase
VFVVAMCFAPRAALAQSTPPAPSAQTETVDTTPPGNTERQRDYAHGHYVLYFIDTIWGLVVLWILLASGLSLRMRRFAERVSKRPSIVVAIYVVCFVLITTLASFPLTLYGGYLRERRFGFANQSLGGWLGDQAKGLVVGLVFTVIVAVIVYAVVRRFPRRFWIGVSAVLVLFMVFALAIAPVFISPLFNRFRSLPDSPLKTSLLEMAHAEGIPARDVFVMDASRQSSHGNAYVAGLLGTQRIVLYDTLLARDTPREIRTVMAHEMGHYVLHHVWKGVLFGAVLIVLATMFARPAFDRVRTRFGSRWGIRDLADPAGLPLALLLLGIASFLLTPVINVVSRHEEHEADAFGLEVARDPVAMASAFRKFALHDLSEYDPPAFIEFWLYSHPSLRHRVEFCADWQREHGG